MSNTVINGLADLLKPKIGDDEAILNYECFPLTRPGDNYGSEMLALNVTMKNKHGKEDKLELVAKKPPKNIQLLAIFQTSRTFIKENCTYTQIVPCVDEFENEVGIDPAKKLKVFCECFGARISLDPTSMKVDQDALLLLKNLKPLNYRTADRFAGFDSEHSRLILTALAKFHATFVALKLLKPNTFKSDVFPFIDKIDIDAGMAPESRKAMIASIKNDIKKIHVRSVDLLTLIDRCIRRQKHLSYPKDHPFVTVIHNDFWINNILIQYQDEHPVSVKLIDFQLISCDSLAHDVLFFIMTSIKDGCFETMIDLWLAFYHEKFYSHLEALNCPTDAYTYAKFIGEVNRSAPWEFYHIVSMLKVVFARQDALPDLENLSDDIFADNNLVGEEYFTRLEKVVAIFIEKNWIL